MGYMEKALAYVAQQPQPEATHTRDLREVPRMITSCARRQKPPGGLPAWRAEIETVWPDDYRREWAELVESYQQAGHPRGFAEYGAYLDLEKDARRFAQEARL